MIKDILQNYYNSLINQKSSETFLSRLSDYIEFVEKNEKCSAIIADIQESKKELFEEKENLEKIVSAEIIESKEGSYDIKRFLEEKGIKVPNKISKENEGDFYADRKIHSESYPKLSEIEEKIKKEQKTKLWSAWDSIHSAYLEFESNPHKMDKEFNVENYKEYVARINNFLLDRLEEENRKDEDVAFRVIYSSYRKIIINGIEIKKLRMDSANDLFFKQVYDNPNQETVVKIPSNRTIHEFINNIGFRDRAKKVFFQASGDKVLLRNPVKKSDLVNLGLENVTLESLFPWIKDSDTK